MQIVIVHYHLNRGGVTQVIVNHLRALSVTAESDGPVRVLVLYGGRKEGWPRDVVERVPGVELIFRVVPALEYDRGGQADPESLARELMAAIGDAGFDADRTVVHVHNHALGKNVSLPGAVRLLAREGFAQLLQIHDFAEDFRPGNYRALSHALNGNDPHPLGEILYPQGSAIHYAVLNGRDYQILGQAGIQAERLHALPNPVSEPANFPDRTAARKRLEKVFQVAPGERYILYPVRGIRRKNLGEFLLSAAAGSGSSRFAITLPPINPVERPRYDAWKQLSQTLQLPALFEVGASGGLRFGENLAAADLIISTSVAEGFGMVFLESWLANCPLVGRDLPEITRDFVQSGVRLDHVADEVRVPIQWLGQAELEAELSNCYAHVLQAYERDIPSRDSTARKIQELMCDGHFDFARCGAKLQTRVISLVASNRWAREALLEQNPAIAAAQTLDLGQLAEAVRRNADAVRRHYGLESFGRRLRKRYREVLDSPRHRSYRLPNGSAILDAFLDIKRLHPIRIES